MVNQADIGKISQAGALTRVGDRIQTLNPEICFIPFVTLGSKGFLAGCVDLVSGDLGLAHVDTDDVFATEGQAMIRAAGIARDASADTDRNLRTG